MTENSECPNCHSKSPVDESGYCPDCDANDEFEFKGDCPMCGIEGGDHYYKCPAYIPRKISGPNYVVTETHHHGDSEPITLPEDVTINTEALKETIVCTCSMHTIMSVGCRCGAFKKEKEAKVK